MPTPKTSRTSTPRSVPPISQGHDWTADVESGSRPLPSDAEDFLRYLARQLNRPPTTVRGYRTDLHKFTAFRRRYAPRHFDRLTDRLSANEWKELLWQYGDALADALPHPRSRLRALVALRQFLKWSYRHGLVKEDLSVEIELPRVVTPDPHPLRTDDVPALLDALPRTTLSELRNRALLYFLLTSGCRISEALSLDRTAIRPEGVRVFGKGGKYRTVYLTQGAWDSVHEYLEWRGVDDASALFISFSPEVFMSGAPLPHNRLSPNGAREILRKLRKTIGTTPQLRKILAEFRSPHVARHTAATTLLEATGGDARLVQEVLGHASLNTLQVYTEITDRRKREAYRKLGAHLGENDVSSASRIE